MTRSLRWIVVALTALLTSLALAFAAQPASAHASLEASHPHPNSILDGSPAQVTLTFGEVVSAQLGGIKVFGPDGKRVDEGKVAAVDNNVTVDLKPNLAKGTYLVSWRVVSADAHAVSGGYSFSVGAPSSTLAKANSATDPWTLRTMWLGRITAELGVVLLVGSLLFAAFVYPAARQLRPFDLLSRIGAGILLLGTTLELLMQGPDAAGLSPGDAFNGDLISTIAKTDYGYAHIIRAVLVLGAVIGLPRLPRLVSLVYSTGLALTFSFSGHAAGEENRLWPLTLDAAHVVAASAWLGGLITLLVVLRAEKKNETSTGEPGVRDALPRFTKLAAASVLLIVATGFIASLREVGSWFALTSTRFGHLLLIKLAFFVVMLALGYISHQRTKRTERNLSTAVFREAGAGLVVIAMTSALIAAPQAKTAALRPYAFTRVVTPNISIELDVTQAKTGVNEVHVYVTDGKGKAVPVEELTATMALPGDGVSPINIQLNPPVSQPIGHKENLAWEISIPGIWTFTVSARTTEIDQYDALFLVPIK